MRSCLRFLLQPSVRYLLAWLSAGITAGIIFVCAWTIFDTPKKQDGVPKRRRGNNGHAMIDFGGQWLMGRTLARGLGQHLYHRNYLWYVVQEAYPRAEEIPPEERAGTEQPEQDAENMMQWLVGQDDRHTAMAVGSFLTPFAGHDPLAALVLVRGTAECVDERVRQATAPQLGGALYPPLHALLMAPLGYLRPAQAYRVVQALGIVLALLAGGALCLLSQGRIWWPVGTLGVMLFPGFDTAMNLGQNSIVLLTLLIGGWLFIARNQPVCAGIAWGLMAFKPVWAVAFFLVPILTRRWRVGLAMLLTALGLVAMTLPVVGWRCWLDWFHVGRMATAIYDTNHNWIFLSRDLVSIPRRWLLDFSAEDALRDSLAATLIGWGLLLAVVACTALLCWLRRTQSRALTGPPAAFVLLGAWLSCYHFMYYDILLTALPVTLLLTEPRHYLKPVLVAIAVLPEGPRQSSLPHYYQPRLECTAPSTSSVFSVSSRHVCVRNSMTLTLITLLALSDLLLPIFGIEVAFSARILKNGPIPLPITYSTAYDGTPWPTFCILALWLWCGWLWLRTPRDAVSRVDRPLAVAPVHAPQLV